MLWIVGIQGNTMNRAKTSFAILAAVLFTGATALAEPTHEGTASELEQEAAAAFCAAPAGSATEEQAAEATTQTAAAKDKLPLYVPPSRGSTLAKVGGSVRGARRPGQRL